MHLQMEEEGTAACPAWKMLEMTISRTLYRVQLKGSSHLKRCHGDHSKPSAFGFKRPVNPTGTNQSMSSRAFDTSLFLIPPAPVTADCKSTVLMWM